MEDAVDPDLEASGSACEEFNIQSRLHIFVDFYNCNDLAPAGKGRPAYLGLCELLVQVLIAEVHPHSHFLACCGYCQIQCVLCQVPGAAVRFGDQSGGKCGIGGVDGRMDCNNVGESILQYINSVLPLHGHRDVIAGGHYLAALYHIRNQSEVRNVALRSQGHNFVGDVDAGCHEEMAVRLQLTP